MSTIRNAISILALGLLAHSGLAAEAVGAAMESPRLAALATADASSKRKLLAEFWQLIEQTHTPLIEPLPVERGPVEPGSVEHGPGLQSEMLVTFVWRSSADETDVQVLSPLGASERGHSVPERLVRLPETDIWFRTYRTSNRARFKYALVWPQGHNLNAAANDSFMHGGLTYESFSDPLNPKSMPLQSDEQRDGTSWVDRVRHISYAEGPNAAAEPFVAERAGIKRGKLITTEFTSKLLGNSRRISVYTPPGLDHGDAQCDFLLLFDRAEYVMAVPTPTILDNMQAAGVLRPTVAVFVGNASGARSAELPPNPRFQAFLRQELLPWIRARYQFTADPRRSVVGGSSFGGLAASYTAFMNADVFGNVLSQSGSYWWWPGLHYQGRDVTALSSGWMTRQYATSSTLPLRFYMDVGLLEGTLMLLPSRMHRDLLQEKGYEVTYREYVGAHDYVMWRSTISDGLIALIGTSSLAHSSEVGPETR